MILGYNTNGFAHHRLDDCLDVLAELGYRSVGLTIDVHHAPPGTDYEALGRACAARGLLPVVETGARFLLDPRRKHFPTLLDARPEPRLRFLADCVDAAAGLGAPCVSLWSGKAPDGAPEATCWDRLVERLGAVCDRAEAAGIDVGFEPEPGMFVDTMARFDELRRRLPHRRLKLTLDVGHVRCLEDEPPDAVLRRYRGVLVNVHLDDHRRGVHDHLMFGEGEIGWPPVLAELEAVDVPATVELSRHSHDAVNTARASFAFFTAPG